MFPVLLDNSAIAAAKLATANSALFRVALTGPLNSAVAALGRSPATMLPALPGLRPDILSNATFAARLAPIMPPTANTYVAREFAGLAPPAMGGAASAAQELATNQAAILRRASAAFRLAHTAGWAATVRTFENTDRIHAFPVRNLTVPADSAFAAAIDALQALEHMTAPLAEADDELTLAAPGVISWLRGVAAAATPLLTRRPYALMKGAVDGAREDRALAGFLLLLVFAAHSVAWAVGTGGVTAGESTLALWVGVLLTYAQAFMRR